MPWTIALLVLAGGYLLAEPLLEARLGVDLPGVHEPNDSAVNDRSPTRSPGDQPRTTTQSPPLAGDAPGLSDVLTEIGRDTYRTEAGLVYGRGSIHRTRLAHLMSHAKDDPNRPGQHGVFDQTDPAKVIQLVDEAYRQALAGKQVQRHVEEDRTVFTVDMGRRIGSIGGESGRRRRHPRAQHIRLVVEGDQFITAYPVIP